MKDKDNDNDKDKGKDENKDKGKDKDENNDKDKDKDYLFRYYAIARPLQYHMVITGLHFSLLFIAKVMTMIMLILIVRNQGAK